MPSRRAFLTTTAGVSLTIAGCLREDATPPSLGEITVLNTRNRSSRVSLVITKHDETVYDSEIILEGRQHSSVDAVSITEPWMGSGTDFRVEVDVPSTETEVFSTTEFEEKFGYGFDCVPLTVYIRDSTIETYYGTNNCSEI